MKILVALSGGVDSAIAALRLKNEKHELIGCYMVLHGDKSVHEDNIKKVEKVASFLKIEYKILDLKDKFFQNVYNPFIEAYKNGKTPNPCVTCNKTIKFGELINFAKNLNCEKIATGHYVKIKNGFLCEAKDKSKDQSYFLSNIKKEALNFMLFPLSDSLKEDVKKEALNIKELNIFATQKESNEICFVEDTYVDILKKHLQVNKDGDVLNTKGEIVGKHKGYMHYTIGKRRGFEVKGALTPHYVLSINPYKNTITVGEKDELNQKEFCANDLNLFTNKNEFTCCVKVRYRSKKVPCFVSIKNNLAFVKLFEDIQGIAKGQRAVFYENDFVIGSGEIL